MGLRGKHIIIYDDEDIHYIEADMVEFNSHCDVIEYQDPMGEATSYPSDSTFTFVTANTFDEDTIKLDETMMKRIAKYNKEKELQKIEKEIALKKIQIKELDDNLKDKAKRWQKVKEYIANIYDLDLEEDDDDDYYFD